MKHFYAIILGICFWATTSVNTLAQTVYPLPQPGFTQSQVYYQDWTQMGVPINYSYVYMYDTVVGVNTFAKYTLNMTYRPAVRYSYYVNGQVYWHLSSSQLSNPLAGTLIYDFSLALGDTFYYPAFSFWYYGAYVVDSVSTMTMQNSQVRKYMRLTNGTHTMHWVDGIGDIVNGLTYMTDFEGGNEKLICSKDSTGDVYAVPNSPFYCSTSNPVPTSGPNSCDQFNYNVTIWGTSCWGCDGAIQISNVTGGTPGYTYTWSNGSTSAFPSNLCQGPITVTIHDAAGDSCSRTFIVHEGQIGLTVTHDNTNCDGADTVCVIPMGGIAPYTWQWSPMGGTTMCYPLPVNGTFTVVVTDANGCTSIVSIPVSNAQPVYAYTTSIIQPSCSNCCDGNVALNISGGTPPYALSGFPTWPSPNNFCGGWYQYCVTDSLDCMYCDSVFVQAPLSIEESGTGFSMFPNPAEERLYIQSNTMGELILIADVNGKIIREKKISSATTEIEIADLSNGIYFVSVGDHTEKLVILRN